MCRLSNSFRFFDCMMSTKFCWVEFTTLGRAFVAGENSAMFLGCVRSHSAGRINAGYATVGSHRHEIYHPVAHTNISRDIPRGRRSVSMRPKDKTVEF